eukprot:TRINITY_DN3161_c0_g1_i2.p1 TRINITY_DN3161_c0_g1~~TRINITY_DN3161_c0_g1_i2.p1  ORF type:complete len:317 (+),score=52.18 TRINITY_DN3161_c0_g1_i2:90-1040(+)
MSSMNLEGRTKNELLYVGFNQDYGCFACGTDTGFFVCNCDPLKERFRKDFENGGIGIVEMLFKCNILALVGRGKNPRFPPNKVMIWDDYQNKCLAELEFKAEVKAVKLRRDRIVVVLENKVYIYNFADLKLVGQIDTASNPRGLCSLCPSNNVLAVPGIKAGSVHIENYDLHTTTIINAHTSGLSQLALNRDGNQLATTSEKGTLIRIFSCEDGTRLKELRRGADKADIYSLAFNADSTALCLSSDKGTIHIFGLTNAQRQQQVDKNTVNKQSSLSFMKDILPSYFSSEWSAAQFHVPEPHAVSTFFFIFHFYNCE